MRRKQRARLFMLAMAIGAALSGWVIYHYQFSSDAGAQQTTNDSPAAPAPTGNPQQPPQPGNADDGTITLADLPQVTPAGSSETPPDQAAGLDDPQTQPLPDPPANAQAAVKAFEKGLALFEAGEILQARYPLTEAVLSDKLDQAREAKAIEVLEKLAAETIFSRRVVDGDPYTFNREIHSGEMLAPLERKLELRVPWELLLRINGIRDARSIRAGQRMKFIRGPAHAIVRKSNFTMDLYLQRDELPRVWVARVPVGLGRGGGTPEGLWRVGGGEGHKGGKLVHPTWTPPESSGQVGPIRYGQPGYALGDKGLWIGLVGLDANTLNRSGYGLHSTDKPESIGKAQSLGCIRLRDDDIELAYSLLYEVRSRVEIRR